jgi:hypothetical protein
MQQWWANNNIPGPLKLYNRDNAAAVSLGEGTDAAARAEDRTCGGAIKVASLAGAIFRHKDWKRGQQHTLRYFWDYETGFNTFASLIPAIPVSNRMLQHAKSSFSTWSSSSNSGFMFGRTRGAAR